MRHPRKIEFNGRTATISEWAAELNIKPTTLYNRIRDWGFERALTQTKGQRRSARPRKIKLIKFNGRTATIAEWAAMLGLSEAHLYIRIKQWGVERALTQPKVERRYATVWRDLTNEQFGRLTVLNKAGKYKGSRHLLWHCSCSCGNTIDVPTNSLRKGRTKSCGCLAKEYRLGTEAARLGRLAIMEKAPHYSYQGQEKPMREWVEVLGMPRWKLHYLMKKEWKDCFKRVS